jgi:hypothetical protein
VVQHGGIILYELPPLFVVWFTSAVLVGWVPCYKGKGRMILVVLRRAVWTQPQLFL